MSFVDPPDFETPGDNGWTHVQVATQDDWQHDVPQGKGGDPSAAFSGSKVWGNDLGPTGFNGLYQPNVTNYLESPTLSMAGQSDVQDRGIEMSESRSKPLPPISEK